MLEAPFGLFSVNKAKNKGTGLFGFGRARAKSDEQDAQHVFDVTTDGVTLRKADGGSSVISLEWRNIMKWSAGKGKLTIWALSEFCNFENASKDEVQKVRLRRAFCFHEISAVVLTYKQLHTAHLASGGRPNCGVHVRRDARHGLQPVSSNERRARAAC